MQTTFNEWASAWGISDLAIADLRMRIASYNRQSLPPETRSMSEAAVQSRLIRDASYERPDVMLWRNNVGAMQDAEGRVVRYGLANESVRQNRVIKSADLIGIRRYTVTPEDVGRDLGVFVSVECKAATWTMPNKPDDHVQAQINWANLVMSYGGVAAFYNGHGPIPF